VRDEHGVPIAHELELELLLPPDVQDPHGA
jgi:hypothetical protein